MGHRVTRVATHLSEDAVSARMHREPHPWCRKLWEIIAHALTAPRKAEDSARTVGVSVSTVHRVMAASNQEGVAAIETPGTGERRRPSLTREHEHALLQPFVTHAMEARDGDGRPYPSGAFGAGGTPGR